jgi:hypothetical protein
MGRSSQAEVRRRVADIYGLVVDGLPYAQIVRYIAANCTWKVSERTIDNYIAIARKQMIEESKVERAEVFAESLARKQRLFARASTGNQLKTALAVQNSIDRMFGDFAGERDELSDVDRFLEALLRPPEG